MPAMKYCESLIQLQRLKTLKVSVGGVTIGNFSPIRVQTMATTSTNDTESTTQQCIKSILAGAELFRITAPSLADAKNLANIKLRLTKLGEKIPLVADIHFNPEVALEAALHVEKVRINPGNYADPRAKFNNVEYTDLEYSAELSKVEERLLPLLTLCKERGVAIRIGVNHGSLSDRIMSRYGDTPAGMVESALEFLRICKKKNFNNVVVSMKASNTRVMVQSTRLLVNRMLDEGMAYPLHLGVTEAGEGEDGRIKSAVGIGTLLADGIGDTIRVSLTEEPEYEIPVAKKLVGYFANRKTLPELSQVEELPYDPFSYTRRNSIPAERIGGNNPPVVIADLSYLHDVKYKDLSDCGWTFNAQTKNWSSGEQSADYIYLGSVNPNIDSLDALPIIQLKPIENITENTNIPKLQFCKVRCNQLNLEMIDKIKGTQNLIIFLETANTNGYADQRSAFIRLIDAGVKTPIIIQREYKDSDIETFQLKSASDIGALLIDGLGDGIMISASSISPKIVCSTAFSILQAARTRTTKTEYISCPGCGRTLFNLQETVSKIKSATSHLKGLKIGVMGCIVNGPGEMADADYGYVGSSTGNVSLYKGKVVYKKNISEATAVDELIQLIKESGDWKERE
jgi:(E)-4-hydroxy-3-methylbut-2-enyl-diphosphate synthase